MSSSPLADIPPGVENGVRYTIMDSLTKTVVEVRRMDLCCGHESNGGMQAAFGASYRCQQSKLSSVGWEPQRLT